MNLFLNNYFIYPLFIIIVSIFLLYFQTDLFSFGQTKIFSNMINSTVQIEKPEIYPNETQIINIQVFDANTNETISLAYVDLMVKDTDNFITKIFSGLTDEMGKFSYIWKIDENAEPGTYNVNLDIVATGYKPLGKTETFTVCSINGCNTT